MAGLGFAQFVLLYVTLAVVLPLTFIALISLLGFYGFLAVVGSIFGAFMVADRIDRRRRR